MAISVLKAIDLILENTNSVKTETIKIENASSRICAKGLKATYPLPNFNNSAMDGYAISFEDIGYEVEIIGTIFAGDNSDLMIKPKTAIKIMTGARVPNNTTAIIPKENIIEVSQNIIKLPNDIKKNQHIRYIGEDINIDDMVINKGDEINFATISLLASQGISNIEVYKKPRVAIFASGEELRPHTENILPHQIYNSNSPSFLARAYELGCEVEFIGSAKDNLESLKEHIKKSLDFDLIITSGGVSVGDADFTKEAFESFDMDFIFNGISIKPGKPTIFGKINNSLILNLPGNPLASQVIFEMFGTLLVQRLRGSSEIYHNIIKAKMKEEYRNKKGRITLTPGNFDGEFFEVSQKRSPGMVSVLNSCNSMIVFDSEVSEVNANTIVNVITIKNKIFSKNNKDFLTYES
jgi:molybdopterin molybdotransferase